MCGPEPKISRPREAIHFLDLQGYPVDRTTAGPCVDQFETVNWSVGEIYSWSVNRIDFLHCTMITASVFFNPECRIHHI